MTKSVFTAFIFGMLAALHTATGYCASNTKVMDTGVMEVRDAAGRRIFLSGPPRRIVVVGAAPFIPLHMLYMYPETIKRLKGFEVKVKAPDAFLTLVDPELDKKQTLHANPGPESVAALNPDLVIAKGTVEGPMARSLERLGIPMLYLGAETPDMFFNDVETLGKVFGNPSRASELIGYFREKLALIRRAVGQVKLREWPDVLVLEYSNRGKNRSLNVPAMGWIQTRQALISGGRPVWLDGLNIRGGWQITGFEQIAAWNPDKIFLIVWYRLKGQEVMDALYRDPGWKLLDAVQKKNLFLFPRDIYGWDSATPRWILGALWMAKMNYPEILDDTVLDMDRAVVEFFNTLYRLDEAVVKTRLLPARGKVK